MTSSTRGQGDAVGAGADAQVGPAGAARMHRTGVEQGPDLAQRRSEVDVPLPVDGGDPGGGPVEADHHPHGGRLAGAVRAEEAGDLAGLDVEGQVVDGAHVAVLLGESSNADHGYPSTPAGSCQPFGHRFGNAPATTERLLRASGGASTAQFDFRESPASRRGRGGSSGPQPVTRKGLAAAAVS